jgi:hypothetical protein
MADHHKRFERWHNKLPKHTHYLVDQVLARIVPVFEAQGFKWYDDFAGGDAKEIGYDEIPLQRREGMLWPTVQIRFSRRRHPEFFIDFAMLPSVCQRWGGDEHQPWTKIKIDVQREKAIVAYAPAYFRLSKSERPGVNGSFGYSWFSLFPHRKLDAEVGEVVLLLPILFGLFDRGIPEAWLTHDKPWFVDKHVMLSGSWYLTEQRCIARQASER